MNALSDLNIVQTSRLEVIGENTILVVDPMYIGGNGILKCTVENPKNLENINPRSYMAFSALVVIAAKAYIYNRLRVPLDKGYVTGGHELSVVKEIVESYSDAASIYLEEILKWKKVAFLNNNISKASFIQSMMPFVC